MAMNTENIFDAIPDEILEKIFLYFQEIPNLTHNNHIRLSSKSLCIDYELQQPYLKQNHAELLQIAYVCRRFNHIIKSQSFWSQKCFYDHVLMPTQDFTDVKVDYERLYVYNPFHPTFNFIKPDRWSRPLGALHYIERFPDQCVPLLDRFQRVSRCRITSYESPGFSQSNIPLFDPSLGQFYRNLRPIIEFSICINTRRGEHCRSIIELKFSDGHHYEKVQEISRANNGRWHRLTYCYCDYESLPTSAAIDINCPITGGYSQFHEMKFAQITLRFLCRSNENLHNTEEFVAIDNPDEMKETQNDLDVHFVDEEF